MEAFRPAYGAYGCGCNTRCPCMYGRPWGASDSRADAIKGVYKWAQGGVAEKLVAMADRLGADAYDVANLINFESGGNPKAKNAVSDATGLIQFIPSTAKRMGTSTSAIYQMSALQQLDLVEQYFAPYRGKLNTVQGVFMAVFYPKAMSWSLDTAFPDSVQKANPGIKVVGDYIRLATRRAKLPGSNERIGTAVETIASYNPVISDAGAARVGGVAARATRRPWLAIGASTMAVIAVVALLARNRASAPLTPAA